jgi:hypothetical protein
MLRPRVSTAKVVIKFLVLAAILTVTVGYLDDPGRVQRFDDRGRGKKEQGFDRQISEMHIG